MIDIEWRDYYGIYRYRGFTIDIEPNISVDNEEFQSLAIWALNHKRYSFPNTAGVPFDDLYSWSEVEEWLFKKYKDIVWIDDVMLLDHGMLWIRYNSGFPEDPSGWDSGQIGFVFTTKERIREFFGVKRVTDKVREKAKEVYLEDLRIFKAYVEGDVYLIRNPIYDTWLLAYGSEDVERIIKNEIEPEIDEFIDDMRKKSLHKIAEYIRNRVPEIYRKPFDRIFIKNIEKNIAVKSAFNEKDLLSSLKV